MIWHEAAHWPTHPPIGIFKQNQIILISSNFIKLVIWPDPTHWPTHWSIHPPYVRVSLQIINLQREFNYLDYIKIYLIFSNMTWPHPLTHWTTHPPTHGWGVSTNHKSSNRIELSQLSQDLFNCYSFDLTPTIDPLTHPTTHTPNHGWGCLYKS